MNKHIVGEIYGGGIVFEVDESGEHGLIAAKKDIKGRYNWSDAINACSDYRLGKHKDWRLPTRDEFYSLYEQRAVVGAFANNSYWSSTECNSYSAWCPSFCFDSYSDDIINKGYPLRVRAIRSF